MSEGSSQASRPCIVRKLGAIQSKTFDLAIVGGGVLGAGIARHAAAKGLSVVVLEAADYASGASSKSTKLMYDGLHNLQFGTIKRVQEAARERQNLHQLAPHLAEPMTMVLPLRSRWQLQKFKLRLSLYEFLGRVGRGDRRASWSASTLAAEEPSIRADEYPHSLAYREYLTDDARLVLALLRSAIADGAEATNYVRVESITQRRNQYFLRSRDILTGAELDVRCRCVVNAAGPWVEQALSGPSSVSNEHSQVAELSLESGSSTVADLDDLSVDVPDSAKSGLGRLTLSKGVHIAVLREHLAINNMIILNTQDQRAIFAIPRGKVTYIGATDVSYESGPTRWPEVMEEDIQYLLAPLENYFTGETLTPEHVVSTWAGLRPLLRESGKAAQEMSRKDEVWRDDQGIIRVAGGKLTGPWLMADDVMAYVASALEREWNDEDLPMALPGGDLYERFAGDEDPSQEFSPVDLRPEIDRIAARYGLGDLEAGRLVRLYGSEVEAVLGNAPTPISSSVFVEEVDWAIATDGALSLEDVLYRRLRCVWFEPTELTELLPAITERMATIFNWDVVEQHRQRVAAEERIAFDLVAVPV